jgi:prepilin-type N-terminal cleavage/methylation domain-containing protein
MQNKKVGFTLIELIVVLAIIGVLVGILVAVIRPQQIFARLRDTQRQSDLNRLANAIQTYIAEFAQNPSAIVLTGDAGIGGINGCLGGSTPTIYYSANTQPTGPFNIPSPSGFGTFTRPRASTSTAVNGTGWLPVNFASATTLNLTALPIDPRNSDIAGSFYYTYACTRDLNFELNANLEVMTDAERDDGGDSTVLYEVGPQKNLLPTTSISNVFYPSP